MKERPLIMSAPMIRALLDGRKSQTRRLVKLRDCRDIFVRRGGFYGAHNDPRLWTFRPWDADEHLDGKGDPLPLYAVKCPFEVGQTIWVKEAMHTKTGNGITTYYSADGTVAMQGHPRGKWTSPIFMPRRLSRITLEITDVRLERLQSISEDDARAEGCFVDEAVHGPCDDSAIDVFCDLWDSINGKTAPWFSDPYVWVLTFRRVGAGEKGRAA